MATKKLFSFTHAEVADRLSKEPNQSAVVEQVLAAHYHIPLDEETLQVAGREVMRLKVTKGAAAKKIHASNGVAILDKDDYDEDQTEYELGAYCAKHGRRMNGGRCPLCALESL